MKKILTVLLAALMLLALAVPAFAADAVVYVDYSKKNTNDGLTAATAKQSFDADGKGAVGVIPEGGTVVASGKLYFGGNYTIKIPVTLTANYGGKDYKNPELAKNPASGQMKMSGGSKLTIKSDVVIDNIILFQEAAQNTILVKEGATLTVTDTVVLMNKTEYHFKVVIEKGAKAILSEQAQKTFTIENNGGTVETYASATPAPTVVKLQIGNTVGYVNDEAKMLDAAPVIKNGRTMLPIRFVAEALGAEVGWDGATSSVTVTTATTKLELKVGTATAKLNGEEKTLDAASFIENGRTYLPVRFVAEALGANVDWDGATSTATITK